MKTTKSLRWPKIGEGWKIPAEAIARSPHSKLDDLVATEVRLINRQIRAVRSRCSDGPIRPVHRRAHVEGVLLFRGCGR
jgi:hypothetical protein